MRGLWIALALLASVQDLDLAAQRIVQAWRRPGIERSARGLTDFGKPVIVAGGLLVVAILDRGTGAVTARIAAVALLPVNLAVEGLKRLVYRPRPDGEHKRSNASFPSSHVANAFAIATVFARRWRRAAIPLFALATAIGLARMVLDRHWLTDVLVGAVLGVGVAWWIARALERRWARPRNAA